MWASLISSRQLKNSTFGTASLPETSCRQRARVVDLGCPVQLHDELLARLAAHCLGKVLRQLHLGGRVVLGVVLRRARHYVIITLPPSTTRMPHDGKQSSKVTYVLHAWLDVDT